MPDVTNEDRAVWAAEACETFAGLTGQNMESELPDIVCDLLTNLLHLADLRGMYVDDLLRIAKMHYDAEIAEEEEADA
jgi:hypothetical protein